MGHGGDEPTIYIWKASEEQCRGLRYMKQAEKSV